MLGVYKWRPKGWETHPDRKNFPREAFEAGAETMLSAIVVELSPFGLRLADDGTVEVVKDNRVAEKGDVLVTRSELEIYAKILNDIRHVKVEYHPDQQEMTEEALRNCQELASKPIHWLEKFLPEDVIGD